MQRVGCPVCGFNEIEVLDEFNQTTFEICPSCGCEAGNEYNDSSTSSHLLMLRERWILIEKCKWHGMAKEMPEKWNPFEQMKLASLDIPKSCM